ncbi:MAG TPA: methionyl-tRNA formyltransferase [Candidatus Limnocylindria bacterium]|nr:methionyl-tRNA formyltransferase [Candidatus Limnocylindria bacterium]
MAAPWRIIFMGTPQIAAATLAHILTGPDTVVGVVTQPDSSAGRGQKISPSPVRKLAASYAIPVIAAEKIRTPEFIQSLRAWQPDIIIVVAFGRILPKTVLELPPQGCVNVHYSLLPKYRGAAPAAWTIINGEAEAGVSTMRLVEKMDAGSIYLQEAIRLSGEETTGSLQTQLTPIGARLLLETLRRLKAGTLGVTEQDESRVTLAPILRKEDGLIDWQRPAIEIERRIRGFDPWPGSFTHFAGKLLKIHRATIVGTERRGGPGEIIRADAAGFWLATSSGVLSLEEVQQENKKRLAGIEFIKGARIKPGDRLE